MNCTFIIPTFNRTEHLQRQLRYCSKAFRDFTICVADGSDAEKASMNRATVEQSGHPHASYYHFPDTHLWQRAVFLLDSISTPYAMLYADDDFAMPSGVHESLHFLDSHPEYATAQGITIGLPGPSLGGSVGWHLNSLVGKISADCPVERAAQHLAGYSHTIYSVHRTSVLHAGLRIAGSPPFSMQTVCLGELAQSLHSLVSGKAAWLDVPFLCRSPSLSSWPAALEMTHPDFSKCIETMRNLVSPAAHPSDKASITQARQLFNHAFTQYFLRGRFSLESPEFDFWNWCSSRASCLKKPDLHEVVNKLKSGEGWSELVAEYPEAATTKLKQSRFKSWFRSAFPPCP